MTELSLAARKQAEKLQRQLQRGEPAIMLSGAAMRRKGLAQLQCWCEDQGIGQPRRGDGGWRFDATTLQQLEQALQALGLAALGTAWADTRIERLQQGAAEHKALGAAPLQHRVLCSFRLPASPVAVTTAPARWVLDMDWRQLDLRAYVGLLVVENADVFYACDTPDWPLARQFADYLLVYRGHDHRAAGLKALQQAWFGGPQVYFGDADPQGVNIALHEGYSHVLLPEAAAFRCGATTLHAPAAQETAQRQLATRLTTMPANQALHAYLQVLVQGRGLLQQAMLHMPLKLISIA